MVDVKKKTPPTLYSENVRTVPTKNNGTVRYSVSVSSIILCLFLSFFLTVKIKRMNVIVIIGKKGCPFSKSARLKALKLDKTGKIRGYIYLNIETVSGQKWCMKHRNRIPSTHTTYPIVLANSRKGGRYDYLGGFNEFDRYFKD